MLGLKKGRWAKRYWLRKKSSLCPIANARINKTSLSPFFVCLYGDHRVRSIHSFCSHIAPLIKGNNVHFINLHMTRRRRHRLFSFSLCVHRRQQQQSTKTREEAKRGEREEFSLRGGHGRKHERANRGTKKELENDDDDDEEDGIFPREEQKEWRR